MAMEALYQVCPLFPATTLVKLLQKLDRYSLMAIDDMSYVRRSELESSVLVELICHHYGRKSLLVTSNQPFREWDDNFPNGSMTVEAVDRLVHNCHIIGIKGESYRQKAVAAWISSDQSDRPTSLTRASRPAQSKRAPPQPSRTTAATCKLVHPLQH